MKKSHLALGAVILLLIAGVALQQKKIESLYSDHLALHEENAALKAAATDASPAKSPDPAESLQAELNKLKSENAKLRNELATLRHSAHSASTNLLRPLKQTASTNSTFPKPVLSFDANTMAEMTPGETIVTGGWPASNGKRTFMFLTLEPSPADQALTFKASIYEIPETQETTLGLAGFRSDAAGNTPSAHVNLADPATSDFMANLRAAEGVKLASSPRLVTRIGEQATIFIGNQVPVGAGKFADVGRTISLQTSQAANGIQVKVGARETALPE